MCRLPGGWWYDTKLQFRVAAGVLVLPFCFSFPSYAYYWLSFFGLKGAYTLGQNKVRAPIPNGHRCDRLTATYH